MARLTVYMSGPLRVVNDKGVDLTPNAPRTRALLALLAEPPVRRRARRWLAAHLWSDRDFAKSSMNLRQTLSDLRRALGTYHDVVAANRTDIWLLPDWVDVRLDGRLTTLEGLHVPDEAFDDWLRSVRGADLDPLSDTESRRDTLGGGLSIIANVGAVTSPTGHVTAGVIADQVSQNLEDMIGSLRTTSPRTANSIEVTTHISETASTALLSARVVYGPSKTVLYSGHRSLAKAQGTTLSPQEIAAFSYTAAHRAMAKLPQVANRDTEEAVALGFAELGRRRLFSYGDGAIEASDTLFAQAFDADPNGTFLAWRAFQRAAQVIEGLTPSSPALKEEADSFLRRAVELSPESAQTQAITALVRLLLFDDVSAALSAAEAGLRRNPACLLSHQALAMTAGAYGDKEAAYRATVFARPALSEDDARHLWDLYHGLVCIATDRHDEAYSALSSASRRCPDFKAPHRQLLALALKKGDEASGRVHLAALQRLEPDFSLDAYLRDPDYPVDTLRNSGLLSQSFEALT